MLKIKAKRLLAAILCFSFIAPMIPVFEPLKANGAEPSNIEGTYEFEDHWYESNPVYAEKRITSISDKLVSSLGSSVDIAAIVNAEMSEHYGKNTPPKDKDALKDSTGNLAIPLFHDTDGNPIKLELIPIRVTKFVKSGGDFDVGIVDVLGMSFDGGEVEYKNIKIRIQGKSQGSNFVQVAIITGDTYSVTDDEWIYNAAMNIGINVPENTTIYFYDDLFNLTFGSNGKAYMDAMGYSTTGGHKGDPMKSLCSMVTDKSSDNSQTFTGTITMDKSKLTDLADCINGGSTEEYKISVVIGGNDSDVVRFDDNGKFDGGYETDSKQFRVFANEVIGHIASNCDSEDERNSYINSKWNGQECFICEFIQTVVSSVSGWDLSVETKDVFTPELKIFTPFHMVEHFMYYSINKSYGNDIGDNEVVEFINKENKTETRVVRVEDVKTLFYSLSSYQQAALARTYTSLCKKFTDENDKWFFKYMYIDEGGGYYSYSNPPTGGEAPNIDEEILEEDVIAFESSPHTPSITPVDVARYADLLARYCYITSAKYRSGQQENSGIYSNELEIMGNGMWSHAGGSFTKMNNDVTVDMVKIPQDVELLEESYGYLVNDSANRQSDYAFDRMATIFYAVSYSFLVVAKSEFGEDNGFTPQDMRMWLRGDSTDSTSKTYREYFTWLDSTRGLTAYEQGALLSKADFGKDADDISLWMFQSIIQLHDLCEHFGIDPATWHEDIYEYYMMYEENRALFEELRNNPIFMGMGYTGGNTQQNPLGRLFSITDKTMSDNWMRGFALSATYTPMVTNLYDASTYDLMDDGSWMTEYFYRYGFHRKALYISTDPNIVVNSKVGRTSSNGRKVCTLKDLLNYERDIELYIDTGFYNASDIEEGLGRVDYATIRAMVEEQALQSTQGTEAEEEQQASQSKAADDILKGTIYDRNYVDETLNLDTKSLLKDEGVTTYSTDVAQHVTKFGGTQELETSLYDAYVLSTDAIIGQDSVFDLYQYSALLGYGVVSAIYRDTQMFNTIMASTTAETTVLKSSKNIIMTEDSTYTDWLSYFNYLMLGNLEKQMNVNVDSMLDLNAPIFIDLFGNIVTESGYVIIPAAANPTLCGLNWNPYCVGFASYLNNLNEVITTTDCSPQFLTWVTGTEYTIVGAPSIVGETEVEVSTVVDNVDLDNNYRGTGGWFIVDKHGRVILKNVELRSNGLASIVSWSTLNAHSDINLRIFQSDAFYEKAKNIYNAKMIMLTTEVLRGAPVETIDYEEEGLTNVAKGDAGIVIAYALDNIFEAISSRGGDYVNSMLTMPNLALQPYMKYIIFFGIKVCVLLMVLLLMVNLFRSGIKGRLGFKAAFSFVFTTIIVASAIYILPSSIKWSYDNANARLLSSEACDIVLYDAMRNSEGQQIGITSVEKIDECTELYMEVGKVHVDWQNVLTKGILTNEYTSFQDIFDDAMQADPMANQWGVVNKGASLYMSTRDIYDSTRIVYNASTNTLSNKLYTTGNITPASNANKDPSNKTDGDTIPYSYSERDTGAAVYSFVSPYYVFLDMLVADINNYNQSHDIKSYNFSADKYGGVITYDVASPYLLSDEFLYDGFDILGLYQVMQTEKQKPSNVYIFTAEDIQNMALSEWYDTQLTEEQKIKKIEQVYDYARAFVSDHRAILKHVPDSMFVKALAFACSVKYNQVFNAPHADSVKMIQVDNRDIMRFMLGDFYTVYSNYPYSFGRFVYKSAGTAGVLLSLILSVIVLISNVIKPVLIMVMFILIVLNICFRELLLNKPNRGVEGYFIGCGLFIITNFIYALLLKLTMVFANTGYPVVCAIVVAIVVQLAYMAALMILIWIQLSEWKDLGYGKMHNMMMHLGGVMGRGRYGYGGYGYGRRGSYGGYGAYGYSTGYGGRNFGNVRGTGFRRRRGVGGYGGYGEYDNPSIDLNLSQQEERRQRHFTSERTIDDMYARDEERYDNAFRRRGRR